MRAAHHLPMPRVRETVRHQVARLIDRVLGDGDNGARRFLDELGRK